MPLISPCDGCGRSFPNKPPGPCRKCALLSTLSEGTDEFISISSFRQCKGCGGAWKHFQGQTCDECAEKENTTPHSNHDSESQHSTINRLSAQAIEAAKIARAHSMDIRFHKKRVNPLNTTAGLNYARAGLGNVATLDKINVHFEVRVKDASQKSSQTIDPAYGKWGRPWGKDEYLSEVLDDCLATVNLTWEKDKAISLLRQEVEFRFSPNKIFLPGTREATVGETYTKYMTGDLAPFYRPAETRLKAANSKGPALFLELYIDKISFDKRAREMQGPPSDDELDHGTRKRRAFSDPEDPSPTTSTQKKRRTGIQADYSHLSSRFVRSVLPKRGISSETYHPIRFIRANAGYVSNTSDVEIVWPEAGNESLLPSALLSTTVFAEGTTKKVYKLMIGSNLYVAKQFFEAGSGTVSREDNIGFLTQELVRLKQGQWFWDQFCILAKDKAIDICQDIQVSEGFLIQEQGVSYTTSQDLPRCETWLVEPRRTTSVIKFSGTLQHPPRHDKIGKTITGFAHFVYEVSKGTLVFADIQGSPMSVNNRDGIILFDFMTHSVDGLSGVGDHGQEGIKTFTEQHKCDFLCFGLGLPSMTPEKESDDESG